MNKHSSKVKETGEEAKRKAERTEENGKDAFLFSKQLYLATCSQLSASIPGPVFGPTVNLPAHSGVIAGTAGGL